MCGRYYIKESTEMDEIIRLMNASPLKLALEKRELGVRTYGERFPSEVVPVIASDRRGKRAVFPMKWGYDIGKLVINARVETAAEKPLFQNDWKGTDALFRHPGILSGNTERGVMGRSTR